MTSIHEQARAEAEKRWPTPDHRASQEEYDSAIASQGAFEDGAEWARARLNEAATRARVVTTVTELDALPVGSVVLDSVSDVHQRQASYLWRDAFGQARDESDIAALLPARVLYEPDGRAGSVDTHTDTPGEDTRD